MTWTRHAPNHVQQDGPEEYVLTCTCGGTFRRTRLADAAIAHERHQHNPRRHPPDMPPRSTT